MSRQIEKGNVMEDIPRVRVKERNMWPTCSRKRAPGPLLTLYQASPTSSKGSVAYCVLEHDKSSALLNKRSCLSWVWIAVSSRSVSAAQRVFRSYFFIFQNISKVLVLLLINIKTKRGRESKEADSMNSTIVRNSFREYLFEWRLQGVQIDWKYRS